MTLTAPAVHALIDDRWFEPLAEYIVAATGLAFYATRPEELASHLVERMNAHRLVECEAYLARLQDDNAGNKELDALIERLTIGETHFFRHTELFEALRTTIFPEIIDRNRPTRRLRVWSAGCANGAEAYSLSILLRRDLGHLLTGWNVSVLGTDVNRQFLAQAIAGRYHEWAFRGTSADFRRECFTASGKSWSIAPRFKEGVSFQYHNLARHPTPSLVHNLFAFDLILCRNVLIYFSPDVAARIVRAMGDCLVEDGWLAVGHAECTGQFEDCFEIVSFRGASAYRKRSSELHLPATPLTEMDVQSAPRSGSPAAPILPHSKHRRPARAPATRRTIAPAVAAKRQSPAPIPPADAVAAQIAHLHRLADHGDIDQAVARCEALVASDPLNPAYHLYLALLLDQTDGHENALAALERAIYLDRGFALAHYYLGLAQQRRARALEASRAFRNVRRLLAGRDQNDALRYAEGLTVADLDDLAARQMEALST